MKNQNNNLSTLPGLVEIDDATAEQCSGGSSYTVNFYSGRNGSDKLLKSIEVDERKGYDLNNLDVTPGTTLGLEAESFSVSAPKGADGYRLTADSRYRKQTATVSANTIFNLDDLQRLPIKTISLNKVNTSYRSPLT